MCIRQILKSAFAEDSPPRHPRSFPGSSNRSRVYPSVVSILASRAADEGLAFWRIKKQLKLPGDSWVSARGLNQKGNTSDDSTGGRIDDGPLRADHRRRFMLCWAALASDVLITRRIGGILRLFFRLVREQIYLEGRCSASPRLSLFPTTITLKYLSCRLATHHSCCGCITRFEDELCNPRLAGKIFSSLSLRDPTQTNETIH